MEYRNGVGSDVRAIGQTHEGRLTGYAAVFNVLSAELGRFRERIAPGAFKRSLAGGDIRAFWNHDTAQVLGRTAAGTLRLEEDDTGLRFSIDLPDTQIGRDALVSVKRGDVSGMSFGFSVPEKGDRWENSGGNLVRTLLDVDLFEVSVVAFPAYNATLVQSGNAGIPTRALAAASVDDAISRMRRRIRLAEISL